MKKIFYPAIHLFIQFFRYFGVSGICLLVDTGTLFVLTEYAGINYLISTFIGYSLGLILNYILSVTWVFKTKRMANRPMEFGIFVVIGCRRIGSSRTRCLFVM